MELFLVIFSNLDSEENFSKNNPLEEGSPEHIKNFYNQISMKILFLVVFSAKILDMFVFPCYYFHGNGLFFKISTQKMKMYPLYITSRWDLNTIYKSFRFLFSDFLKVMKMLGITFNDPEVFEGFNHFFALLQIFKRFIIQGFNENHSTSHLNCLP